MWSGQSEGDSISRSEPVSPGFIEADAATRMIQRMADEDKSDYMAARRKVMDMLGGIPLGRPNRPAATDVHDEVDLVTIPSNRQDRTGAPKVRSARDPFLSEGGPGMISC